MKLKRVKVFGFKTFADKTEIDLNGKIIAVVGPNGCGKSNIVDAILWGLGEANSRALRAATSKEVIFAGSVHRKPLGFAEVSLLFDNEDGSLPIESPEVLITRKLTRTGESDYSINRRSCRLRDVNDLLADSGLGRAGYAIVGQSEIDQALAASAQQRRAWIDEAAGVQRYRSRRTEAIRRLENAAEHLARLTDILSEIETQRIPLEAEAEVAKRYKQIQSSLRGIECGLLINDLSAALTEITALDERILGTTKLLEAENERVSSLEKQIHSGNDTLEHHDENLEKLRQAHSQAQSHLEHAIATLQVATHKLESLDLLEDSWAEESEQGTARLAEAERDLLAAKEESERETGCLDQLRFDLGGVDEEAKQLKDRLHALEKELGAARKLLADQQRIEVELAHRKDRLRQIKLELQGIEQSIPDLNDGVSEAESSFNEIESKVIAAQAKIREADAAQVELNQREELGGAERRKLLAEIATMDGRRRGIEATIESHEGLAQGSKAVLTAVKRGEIAGDYVPVGEVIEVDQDLSLALDTALGGASNDLIVPDEQHAKQAIALLKQNRLGRATFQPLTLMRHHSVGQDLRRTLSERGVVGLASELARCDGRYRPVIDSLLGRVVIMEDLDAALKLARTSGWSRMVTLDGQVVHSSGAVTGGATQRQGSGLVQRKSELADLQHRLTQLQAELSKAESNAGGHDSERESIRLAREAAVAEVQSLRMEHEEARTWLLNLRHELLATEKSKEKLSQEIASLSASEGQKLVQVNPEALEDERTEVLRKFAAKSSDAESASARLSEAEARAFQAKQRFDEANRRRHNLLETQQSREKKAANLEPEREKCRTAITEATEAKGRGEREVQDFRESVASLMHERTTLVRSIEEWRNEIRDAERVAASLSQTIHQSEIQRAKADARRTSTVERLLEEYGLDQSDAMSQVGQHEVPDDAASVVAKLRRDLKGMGDVNLGAIDAFDRLNERYQELNEQVEDLLRGKDEIEASVKELDRLTKDKFKETFAKVQESFAKMFVHIFGGGEGSLELSQAENILESGVDIQVTIPGKKRQRLELLSGGERAMSALAFLFSLLHVKPSPLVILDEVDAPLDGRNVDRFIRTMREFHGDTQFILITHNPVTIESADVWFGVTMQEPGVSTLVPYKVPEREPVKAIVPDAYMKG